MSTERELKLSVDGDPPSLSSLTSLAGRALAFAGLESQVNAYYDTPALALAGAGCSLRVRVTGERATLTLKGPSVRTATHVERDEFEWPVADGGFAAALEVEAVRSRVAALVDPAALVVVARSETRRERFALSGVGEVAVDRVVVRRDDGSAALEFAEVEVELSAGVDAAVLDDVGAALRALAPMRRSSMGKYGRALAAVRRDAL